ncbi:MAG: hypothetical protein O2973_09895 [Gemmatimonadetes bacterium]|nr:hypothetical protein [Gemmatimonadota bacterium]
MHSKLLNAICAGAVVALCATEATAQRIDIGLGLRVGVSAAAGPLFQASTSTSEKPPLEPARVAGQLLAGAYAGIGGYVIGSLAGGALTGAMPGVSDDAKSTIKFTAGVLGAAAATAGAVWTVGDIGDQAGSYTDALIGTAGGIATAFLFNRLVYGHARLPSEPGSSRLRWIEASLEALLPSLGATIVFNSNRRYK